MRPTLRGLKAIGGVRRWEVGPTPAVEPVPGGPGALAGGVPPGALVRG